MKVGNSRRDFIKKAALASVGIIAAPSLFGMPHAEETPHTKAPRPRPKGAVPVHDLTTNPRERVRVGIIGLGHRGGGAMLSSVLQVPFAEVTALADSVPEQVEKARDFCELRRPSRPSPKVYSGSESAWEALCERDDLDIVYICTPWDLHVPMALKAMACGKHAFVEAASAISNDDCWDLVDASELSRRHCVLLENCCYGENELFVLKMAQEGVFGTLTHAECAYIHDLRHLLFQNGGEGAWRRRYHMRLNGNLYTTHGLGPACRYLGIHRGDTLTSLVSMSSPEAGLSEYRSREGGHEHEKYVCGDMNTTLIKTALGRTILLQHDTVSPRPYSRINMLSGTGGTFCDYPARLAIDSPQQYGLEAPEGSCAWLGAADMEKMRERFTHPLWRDLNPGNGGMDYVMNYRLLDCIRQGITPDINVYDFAAWCAVSELSVRSVESGSMPMEIPDFTRGTQRA